mmetsp:Transcript_3387/g.10156  ORF Transcript_3387/g.10156 Transcript_3387/m.10156 type:complete len:106 (+) Transcript_3387:1378-1695(+)
MQSQWWPQAEVLAMSRACTEGGSSISSSSGGGGGSGGSGSGGGGGGSSCSSRRRSSSKVPGPCCAITIVGSVLELVRGRPLLHRSRVPTRCCFLTQLHGCTGVVF